MNRLISFSIGFWTLLCSLAAVEFHVSPRGNDNNPGTERQPFATPERARTAVREWTQKNTRATLTVVLHGGKYFREIPFRLSREDSGTSRAPIVWKGLERNGQRPRWIGGKPLAPSAFQPLAPNSPVWPRIPEDAREHVLKMDLKTQGIGDYGRLTRRGFHNRSEPAHAELIFNNEVMQLARWPNSGFASTGKTSDGATFEYEGGRPERWVNATEPWAFGYWRHGWADEYVAIRKIDADKKTIALADAPRYAMQEGREWYALNLLEEIDRPGEWFLDREEGALYFWPPSNVSESEMFLTTMGGQGEDLIEIRNASWILLQGLTLEASRAGGVSIEDSHHVVAEDFIVRNLGDYGVAIEGSDCGIANSELYGLGGHGVSLRGGDRASLTRGNLFAVNNHIHHFARWSRTYNAGINPGGVGCVVRNNLIHHCPHSAILTGGNEHVFEFNEIHHACQESDDAGSFYAGRDWSARGMEIRHNFFHDIGSSLHKRLGVHAVYLDDCLSGERVFGNVFYNVSGRAVMCGGGRDNLMENNVVVKCGSAFFTDRRGLAWVVDERGSSWNLREKIQRLNYQQPPWSGVYPQLANIMANGYERAKEPEGCLIRNNIGWQNEQWLEENCLGKCGGFDFYQIDHNLENTDPKFVDEENLNLALNPDSPAYDLPGFQRIPFESIGLMENPIQGAAWLYYPDSLPDRAR